MKNKKLLDLIFSRRAKRVLSFLFVFFVIAFLFLSTSPALAQVGNEGLGQFANETGLPATSLPALIGRIVRIAIGFLGLIAVIIIIYGGFIWMTSGGDKDKIDKAKKLMRAGLIGLIIVVLAYALASFIIYLIGRIVGPGGGGTSCTNGQVNGCYLCTNGQWVYDSNLPGCGFPPDAFSINKILTTYGQGDNHGPDVYLCSAVEPMFNHWVDGTVIQQLAQANRLKIVDPQNNIVSGTWQSASNMSIFKHPTLLLPNTTYRAFLPKEIADTNGKLLQRCQADGGCPFDASSQSYVWTFTTGTNTDTTKPYITSTYPIFKNTDPTYPNRNVSIKPIIEVNFSESIDMTTVVDKDGNLITDNIWVAKLDKQNGNIVKTLPSSDWTAELNDRGFRFYLKGNNTLDPFAWYQVHVGNVADLCSNLMDPAVNWDFETNDRAPGIESYYPTGTQACPNTNIAIIFNTSMYEQDVTLDVFQGAQNILHGEMKPAQVGPPYSINGVGGRFYVEDNNDNPIDNNFRVFIFDPSTDLANNTQYQVKVATDLVIDVQGNTLKQNWTFTTATPQTCLCAPFITYLNPNSGPQGQCVTVNGECFTGTPAQPAAPKDGNINFIFKDANNNPVAVTSTVEAVTDNNLTTTVPITSYPDLYPKAQLIIKYGPPNNSELTSNQSEFYINQSGTANGPCLWSIVPSSGKVGDRVTLNGIRFGPGDPATDYVTFTDQQKVKDCPGGDCGWSNNIIMRVKVPDKAEAGDVTVTNIHGASNGVPFTVVVPGGGVGDFCSIEGQSACQTGPQQCQNPNTYFCLVNETDCRCCCRPDPNSCQNGLTCMANQGACSGSTRGLCCGCQSDEQCGGGSGCGILDPNRCCWPNPTIESKNPNDGAQGVCKNTSVQVVFDQVMDPGSLSSSNINLAQCDDQNCANTTSTPAAIIVDQYKAPDKTGFTLYPRGCLLQSNTWYQVSVKGKQLGGHMGDGVRSVKGVSMSGTEKWVFQTGDNLCVVDTVTLHPTSATIAVSATQHYSATASASSTPICVPSFDWTSSDTNIATVNPAAGPETLATGVSRGQTIISGGVWVGDKIRHLVKGDSTLNVRLTSLAIENDATCNPTQQQYPSPNPQPDNQQVCKNIQIAARFNKKVKHDSVNDQTVQIVNTANQIPVVAKSISVVLDGPNKEKFIFEPQANLEENATYRATVKGGDNGVIGADDSTMAQDYTWDFKTIGGQICPVEGVEVDPGSNIISQINGTAPYQSFALGSNCQLLTSNSSWQWSSTDPSVASVNPSGPQPQTIATGLALGETDITAAAGDKSNFGHLIVDTPPVVTDESPINNSTNVCPNALIVAKFDQEMDHTTLNADNVILWEWLTSAHSLRPNGLFENLALKIKDLFLNITQAQVAPPPGYWSKVSGQIVNYDVIKNQGRKFSLITTTTFIPDHTLDLSAKFKVTISHNVKSKYGVSMGAGPSDDVSWTFTTGSQICHINHVLIDPTSALFSSANQSQNFAATIYASNNEPIVPVPGGYSWTWQWTSSQSNIVSVAGQPNSNPSIGVGTSDNTNGTAILTATATDNLPTPTVVSGTVPVRVYLCENPWVYDNNDYNFELTYCRDGNPLLPALTGPAVVQVPPTGNLKLHLLFNVTGKPDLIGLMVYDNFDHLTPSQWYQANVSNPGSPGTLAVDGYQAIRDGRTIYVNAANADYGAGPNRRLYPNLYSDVFLVSYNDNAAPETINIDNQLIQNWQFNINVRADKDKLVRDLGRIYHFNQFGAILDKYYKTNRSYPDLQAGTYIKSISVSRWPSWQQTLAQVLGAPLPIDPLNIFVNRACIGNYQCCANCPKSDPQCSTTCYNPDPNQKKYECVASSNVYQYIYQNSTTYSLYSNFEYPQPDYWQHNCASHATAALCALHNWCAWNNNQCQAKTLNYSGDPCSSPSTCACFNMRYQPASASSNGQNQQNGQGD